MNTSKLNLKKATFKLITLLFVLFATTSMVCAESVKPPKKLQKINTWLREEVDCSKLPNGRGYKINKGPYKGDILERDASAKKNPNKSDKNKSDESAEEDKKDKKDKPGGHRGAEWKLKDRKGRSRNLEFDKEGYLRKDENGKTVTEREAKKNEAEAEEKKYGKKKTSKKKRKMSDDKKKAVATVATVAGVAGVAVACILVPGLLPYVGTIAWEYKKNTM